MKANEMQRYRYQNDFPNDYDGIVDDKDGELVFYEDAMQVIQALEAKIKGMIDRPTISIRVLEREAFSTRYLLRLNEFPIDGFYSLDSAEASGKLLTKALGMEGEEYD